MNVVKPPLTDVQFGSATGVVQLDVDSALVAAVVAEAVGMEVMVGTTVLPEVINVVATTAEEDTVGSIVIAVLVRLGRIVGMDGELVGRVGREGLMITDTVAGVDDRDGIMLERMGGGTHGRSVAVDKLIGKVIIEDTPIVEDKLIGKVIVEDTPSAVDGLTEDETVRRVLAVDESSDEKVVVGMMAAEVAVDDRVPELPVDGLELALEEPPFDALLEEMMVLSPLLDGALVNDVEAGPLEDVTLEMLEVTFEVAEVALKVVEITLDVDSVVEATVVVVLGVTVLLVWEETFEIEIIGAVEV